MLKNRAFLRTFLELKSELNLNSNSYVPKDNAQRFERMSRNSPPLLSIILRTTSVHNPPVSERRNLYFEAMRVALIGLLHTVVQSPAPVDLLAVQCAITACTLPFIAIGLPLNAWCAENLCY